MESPWKKNNCQNGNGSEHGENMGKKQVDSIHKNGIDVEKQGWNPAIQIVLMYKIQ